MKVIVDAFGGDNAPLEILKGSVLAQQELGVEIVLCGRTQEIEECAKDNKLDISKMEIIEAPDIVTMNTPAREIIKSSSNSSMAVGLKSLANGKGDAFVSAGSTGALVMGATFFVKRIKGVKRASLATIIPSNEKPFMLVDCGANSECTPEMLSGFAVMGSVYMNKVQGAENPRVGLLNIGTEESKGTELQQKTYALLKKEGKVNFIGNVEAREVPSGVADVVVCDGFTGNIFLKTFEGVANVIMKNIKNIFTKNIFTKLASLTIKGGVIEFKKRMDYSEFGGAPLMGISKPVIKAHGSSNAKSIKNAIKQACIYAQQDVIKTIADNLPQEKIKEIDE
ncbi:MAG: phosphate acyltransferase PlsX [Clostridia bacterium]|nr:phosphate acyltransferase PlsX [Clostridia bacterium]